MRPDPNELCILVLEAEDKAPKYFTGRIEGTWPEYLKDRTRAKELARSRAEMLAGEFNRRMDLQEGGPLRWVTEAVQGGTKVAPEARINGG